MRPFLEPVNGAERKIRRHPALPADQFRAAPHIVNHPRRQPHMIRIAPDLAGVARQGRDQIANICSTQLDQQIGFRHLAPKFRLNDVALETGGQRLERVQNQKMRADVDGMPVMLMRNENHAWTLFRQNSGNDFDRQSPMCPVLFP